MRCSFSSRRRGSSTPLTERAFNIAAVGFASVIMIPLKAGSGIASVLPQCVMAMPAGARTRLRGPINKQLLFHKRPLDGSACAGSCLRAWRLLSPSEEVLQDLLQHDYNTKVCQGDLLQHDQNIRSLLGVRVAPSRATAKGVIR